MALEKMLHDKAIAVVSVSLMNALFVWETKQRKLQVQVIIKWSEFNVLLNTLS